MKVKIPILLLLSIFSFGFFSCESENEEEFNEEELITTVRLTFIEAGGSSVKNFEFKDIDGPGGSAPSLFEPIVLTAGKSYNMSISLLDESKNPLDDITVEVREEGVDHQFYFTVANNVVSISELDKDINGFPLGLSSKWVTGAAATGTVKVTLKHKPGIKAMDDPIEKGETDIELNWETRVQ